MTLVITRDKYVLPPEAYTYDLPFPKGCYLTINPLPVSDLYVRIGNNFMKTFYTKFDYQDNEVLFGVLVTVNSWEGAIR